MSNLALTDGMRQSTMTERLDERDLLGVAHGAGCYALEVDAPDSEAACRERWLTHHDHEPPEDTLARVAQADRVAYVGASNDVYDRLCDHVAGDVRRAAFLAAFEPTRVVNVWEHDRPFDAEFNRAMRLVRDGWVCWSDGVLLG